MTDDLRLPNGHFDLDLLLQRDDEMIQNAANRVFPLIRSDSDFDQLIDDLYARWETDAAEHMDHLLNTLLNGGTI